MVDADAVLSALREHADPVVTANEIAGAVGCTRRAALMKLDSLEEVGPLESKKVGARGRIFWEPSREPSKASLTEPSREPTREKEPSTEPSTETPMPSYGLSEDLRERVGDSISGTGDLRERRVDAVEAAFEMIRSEGHGSAKDLRESVYDSSETGFQSPRSLWKNCLLPGLRVVSNHREDLQRPPEGGHTWHHTHSSSS